MIEEQLCDFYLEQIDSDKCECDFMILSNARNCDRRTYLNETLKSSDKDESVQMIACRQW